MGGIALGKGVTSSGLLDVMDNTIRDIVQGLSLYIVVLVLSLIVLVCSICKVVETENSLLLCKVVSTFISHTIASVLLVPIAKEVGSHMPGNRENLLIFLTGLLCSTGMGMPVSGFPNQTACARDVILCVIYSLSVTASANQENDMGQLYLSNIDFLKNGVPASVISAMVCACLGCHWFQFRLIKLYIGCGNNRFPSYAGNWVCHLLTRTGSPLLICPTVYDEFSWSSQSIV